MRVTLRAGSLNIPSCFVHFTIFLLFLLFSLEILPPFLIYPPTFFFIPIFGLIPQHLRNFFGIDECTTARMNDLLSQASSEEQHMG
jgi:hypothetical protein